MVMSIFQSNGNVMHYIAMYLTPGLIGTSYIEQELLTFLEHLIMCSPQVFCGICVAQYSVFCVLFCKSMFVPFLLAIVLSVLPPFTTSDCFFGISIFTLCISVKLWGWFFLIFDSNFVSICTMHWLCKGMSQQVPGMEREKLILSSVFACFTGVVLYYVFVCVCVWFFFPYNTFIYTMLVYIQMYVFLTNETVQFLFLAVWDILVSTRGWDKNFTLLFP